MRKLSLTAGDGQERESRAKLLRSVVDFTATLQHWSKTSRDTGPRREMMAPVSFLETPAVSCSWKERIKTSAIRSSDEAYFIPDLADLSIAANESSSLFAS